MSSRIDRLSLTIHIDLMPGSRVLKIGYTPQSASGPLAMLEGSVSLREEDWQRQLRQRLEQIAQILRAKVAKGEFELDASVVSFATNIWTVTYDVDAADIHMTLAVWDAFPTVYLSLHELTHAQQRLLGSVAATAERLAWEHLRQRVGLDASDAPNVEVLLSYRSTKYEFAEALARRLGQEGIVPFFDKWDVKAGDSIPGKIEEAFGRSIACIIILSDDFTLGQWATAEMETAITKRIQEEYKVIPVLYEKCDIPELLKPLRHVDFSGHDPQTFESKFAELIDAIYGLELNPFRV